MSDGDAMFTLWQRALGDALFLARRRRADGALAAAFPAMPPAERWRVLRRSARLQARLGRERFARRDAVELCRRLAIDGAENLQRLRRCAAEGTARVFTGACGAPELAARAVALYGGVPDLPVAVLPRAGGAAAAPCELLAQAVDCDTSWVSGVRATVFPVFGTLEPHRQARVALLPPLIHDGDSSATTRAALATLESAVRARPEIWPWARADG